MGRVETPFQTALLRCCRKGGYGANIHGGARWQTVGLPDTFVSVHGRSTWIECKVDGRKYSPKQAQTIYLMNKERDWPIALGARGAIVNTARKQWAVQWEMVEFKSGETIVTRLLEPMNLPVDALRFAGQLERVFDEYRAVSRGDVG